MSGRINRYRDGRYDLDLTYVTDRLIAMAKPFSNGHERDGKNRAKDVARMLEERHPGGAYRVVDLTLEAPDAYDAVEFGGRVDRVGFADHHAPPLPQAWAILCRVTSWLAASPRNVAALHCHAGRGRTGCIVSGLLLVMGTCATATDALALFARRRGVAVRSGSQKRYVGFIERHLRCPLSPPPSSPPLPLPMVVSSVGLVDAPPPSAGAEYAVEIVELAWPHSPIALPRSMADVEAVVSGDFMVRVVERSEKSESRPLFRFAVHTAFIDPARVLRLRTDDLDGAFTGGFYDLTFPPSFVVEVKLRSIRHPKL